jgi:hypothetical protein
MGKPKTPNEKISEIKTLRKKGLSLDEILKIIPIGRTTLYKYVKDVKAPCDLRKTGSARKAKRDWNESRITASNLIKNISIEGEILILASLYWGEGTKNELNIINSDPNLIRVFVNCLKRIGVKKEDLLVSIRIYEDMNLEKVKTFWAKNIDIDRSLIKSVNILFGKKKGRLEYGMCRVRVRKGARYFKIIMSMIDLIKSRL